jgi:fatty acid desaturase
VAFAFVGNSWWQVLTAVYLAFAFGQTAFLGHDAGHKQIFRTRRPNDLIGLVNGTLLVGLSYGWWVNKHNKHHSNPNHEGLDPDIAIGAIAFSADQARGKRGVNRIIAKHQAWLFFPLLTLEAFHLHAASVKAILSGRVKSTPLEASLLLVHLVGYLGAVFLVLSPLRAVVFIVAQQALFGLYLGCAFAPNHKGMPILAEGEQLDFLRKQVLTSRNVRGGRFVDFLLGGLNYQVEHHLFPSMPRPSLRRSHALIRGFCAELGVPYAADGLFRSYAEVLEHLHRVGSPIREWVVE